MRLIDADALEELFREVIGAISQKPEMTGALEHMVRASAMTIEMINDAPTIEERKTGKWIYIRAEENGNGLYQCSVCSKGDIHAPEVEVSYCWNCGAKMGTSHE